MDIPLKLTELYLREIVVIAKSFEGGGGLFPAGFVAYIVTTRNHKGPNNMQSVKVRDAKARLSALVEAAENGEPTIITKYGKPAAMVVPIDKARKLYPQSQEKEMNFVEFLMTFPGGIEFERDDVPMRDVDL